MQLISDFLSFLKLKLGKVLFLRKCPKEDTGNDLITPVHMVLEQSFTLNHFFFVILQNNFSGLHNVTFGEHGMNQKI